MKILTPHQIRDIDQFTINNEPIPSIDLMERAAQSAANWILDHRPTKKHYVFAGIGNNGGDGLAMARILNDFNLECTVFLLKISNNLSPDAQANLNRLKEIEKVDIIEVSDANDISYGSINSKATIIDAIFGSGLNRPTEGLAKNVIKRINQLNNTVISIDIPSGLFATPEKEEIDDSGIIKASYTLTFQIPKLAFLFPENYKYVGNWQILNIGLLQEGIDQHNTNYYYIDNKLAKSLKKNRYKYSHKGTFGHALLIAGSYGKMGAAVLSTKACLRAGVGLLTSHVPHWGYQIMQTTVPEAMTSIDRSEMIFTEFPDLADYNAVGIGPGLNTKHNTVLAMEELLHQITSQNLVIDADGLNILSENRKMITSLPKYSILTPHPKEFERLAGTWKNDFERLNLLQHFSQQNQVITVLKGAHTTIALPDGTCYFNSTGNPGMATAGSGDALTGIILALLAQGYSPKESAILGVYIHGLSADMALQSESEESIITSDIISKLGAAFKSINQN